MLRRIVALLMLMSPALVLLSAGCEQKVTTVEKSEQVHESEPQMVSPGTEVLE